MFNNKKGAELPMNTIIIAIIVVVVLFIVIVFFIGGTASIGQKLQSIFGGASAAYDMPTAKQFCEGYCDNVAQNAYCFKIFKVDNDQNPDTPLENWQCGPNSAATWKDKQGNEHSAEGNLGVYCSTIDCLKVNK